MKNIVAVLVLSSLLSCNKMDKLKDVAPELIGDWAHYSKNDGFHYIYINEKGKGSMHGENEHGNNQDTQGRRWFVENDILYFSRWYNNAKEDMFTIDQYPIVADTTMGLDYDTINTGDTYIILNNRHYVKFN